MVFKEMMYTPHGIRTIHSAGIRPHSTFTLDVSARASTDMAWDFLLGITHREPDPAPTLADTSIPSEPPEHHTPPEPSDVAMPQSTEDQQNDTMSHVVPQDPTDDDSHAISGNASLLSINNSSFNQKGIEMLHHLMDMKNPISKSSVSTIYNALSHQTIELTEIFETFAKRLRLMQLKPQPQPPTELCPTSRYH